MSPFKRVLIIEQKKVIITISGGLKFLQVPLCIRICMGKSPSGGINKSMASGQKKPGSQRSVLTFRKLKQKLNGPVF